MKGLTYFKWTSDPGTWCDLMIMFQESTNWMSQSFLIVSCGVKINTQKAGNGCSDFRLHLCWLNVTDDLQVWSFAYLKWAQYRTSDIKSMLCIDYSDLYRVNKCTTGCYEDHCFLRFNPQIPGETSQKMGVVVFGDEIWVIPKYIEIILINDAPGYSWMGYLNMQKKQLYSNKVIINYSILLTL